MLGLFEIALSKRRADLFLIKSHLEQFQAFCIFQQMESCLQISSNFVIFFRDGAELSLDSSNFAEYSQFSRKFTEIRLRRNPQITGLGYIEFRSKFQMHLKVCQICATPADEVC